MAKETRKPARRTRKFHPITVRLPLDRKAAWDALKSAEQGKVGDRAKVTDGGLALAAMLEMMARGGVGA